MEEGWLTIFNKNMDIRGEKGDKSLKLRGLFQ
jgi:hypothetical protein